MDREARAEAERERARRYRRRSRWFAAIALALSVVSFIASVMWLASSVTDELRNSGGLRCVVLEVWAGKASRELGCPP